MVSRRVNPVWLEETVTSFKTNSTASYTTSFNKAAQALIVRLDKENIPYKLYNLGAGVKKITRQTDICPCCKRKL